MKLIQSYIAEAFFVSTIYRASSAAMIPTPWYFETMVWAWDAETRLAGDLISQHDSGIFATDALSNHCQICNSLFNTTLEDYKRKQNLAKNEDRGLH
jgi:hypothetical protein